jgi:hypothetical protein
MSYDEGRYLTKQMLPMYKATYAGALLGTIATNTNVQTSAILSDRIKFFQKIKVTGMKYIPEVAPDAGSHATSMTTSFVLTDGTTAFARARPGTVAGVVTDGSILSANIAAGKQLQLDAQVTTWDGTVQTMAPGGGWVQLEYQERF